MSAEDPEHRKTVERHVLPYANLYPGQSDERLLDGVARQVEATLQRIVDHGGEIVLSHVIEVNRRGEAPVRGLALYACYDVEVDAEGVDPAEQAVDVPPAAQEPGTYSPGY